MAKIIHAFLIGLAGALSVAAIEYIESVAGDMGTGPEAMLVVAMLGFAARGIGALVKKLPIP